MTGGGSRRFGSNKAFAPYGTKRIIDHIISSAKEVTDTIVIVTKSPEQYQFSGVRTIEDFSEVSTPIVGIITAMQEIESQELIILSCDTLWYPDDLLQKLIAEPAEYGEALLVSHDGAVHPFPGRYNRSCLSYFQNAMEKRQFRILRIIEQMDYSSLSAEGWWMKNINNKEDLDEANHDRKNLLSKTI